MPLPCIGKWKKFPVMILYRKPVKINKRVHNVAAYNI